MRVVSYRSDIDGLRALAVLPVVLFHVDPALVPGGFLGVDVFFVISGYLISLILFRQLADGSFRVGDFYGRRVRRLFPALVLVLAAVLGFGFFALLADEYERLARHAAFAIPFLLNIRLLGETGYFDVVSHSKPLLHLWSLSVEEQFYLSWPLLLILARRLRVQTGWLLALCAVWSFGFAVWFGAISPDRAYFHPLTRFWELLAGAAVAYLHHRRGVHWLPQALQQSARRDALSVAGLFLLLTALFMFGKGLPHPGWASLWPLLGAVALLACGPDAIANRLIAFRPLVFVGLISYPLYLWHWPILSYLRVMESGTPSPHALWLGASLSVVLAALTYRLVERPVRDLAGKRVVTLALVVAMAGLFVVAAMIVSGRGWPERARLGYIATHAPQMVREPAQDKSCTEQLQGKPTPVYCRQHMPGPRMIALIGDSHAHVLFAGVSALAASKGYGTLLLANSGCPPLLGAVTGRNATERQECARSIDALLSAVADDKRIVSVVIASRGPQYLNGLGYGPVEAHYNYPPIAAALPDPAGAQPDPATVFADGLFATAKQLHQHDLRVSYFLQVPELGIPARDCLGRPLTLLSDGNNCSVRYADYNDRMLQYRDLVRRVAERAPFLRLVDPEPLLCNSERCSGFINNTLLYADDNHLSVAGSRLVAPLVLRRALDGDALK